MPNTTKNYQLNQWEPDDYFLRTDFNADNAKLDAALSLKCEMVAGTYTGDGTASREITLGFAPKAVLLCNQQGQMGDSTGQSFYYGGLALPNAPILAGEVTALAVTENGFQVTQDSSGAYVYTNFNGKTYHYLAFK